MHSRNSCNRTMRMSSTTATRFTRYYLILIPASAIIEGSAWG